MARGGNKDNGLSILVINCGVSSGKEQDFKHNGLERLVDFHLVRLGEPGSSENLIYVN